MKFIKDNVIRELKYIFVTEVPGDDDEDLDSGIYESAVKRDDPIELFRAFRIVDMSIFYEKGIWFQQMSEDNIMKVGAFYDEIYDESNEKTWKTFRRGALNSVEWMLICFFYYEKKIGEIDFWKNLTYFHDPDKWCKIDRVWHYITDDADFIFEEFDESYYIDSYKYYYNEISSDNFHSVFFHDTDAIDEFLSDYCGLRMGVEFYIFYSDEEMRQLCSILIEWINKLNKILQSINPELTIKLID